MTNRDRDSLLSDINVTPFVDVMLVLLIIFMVAAPMMVQGVDVAIPETKSAQQLDTEKEPLVISIDKDAVIRINDYEVGIDLLGEKLGKIFENRTSREVFLKADENVAYGRVAAVMAEIQSAGVERLGVVTEPTGNTGRSEKD
ncbi:MAG: ExbD/TolR family protein [Desulfobacteraceae bacterium]|nr:ExbD/TolR family protein [Desulfobacteraceae bacterium]